MRHRTLTRPRNNSTLLPVRGPRTLPLQSALRLRADPAQFAENLRADYGDIAFITVLGRNIVIVQGPEGSASWFATPTARFATSRYTDSPSAPSSNAESC